MGKARTNTICSSESLKGSWVGHIRLFASKSVCVWGGLAANYRVNRKSGPLILNAQFPSPLHIASQTTRGFSLWRGWNRGSWAIEQQEQLRVGAPYWKQEALSEHTHPRFKPWPRLQPPSHLTSLGSQRLARLLSSKAFILPESGKNWKVLPGRIWLAQEKWPLNPDIEASPTKEPNQITPHRSSESYLALPLNMSSHRELQDI